MGVCDKDRNSSKEASSVSSSVDRLAGSGGGTSWASTSTDRLVSGRGSSATGPSSGGHGDEQGR